MVAPVTKPPPVPVGQAEQFGDPAQRHGVQRRRRPETSPRGPRSGPTPTDSQAAAWAIGSAPPVTNPKYRGPPLATVAGEPYSSSRASTEPASRPVPGSAKSSRSSAATAGGGRHRPVGQPAEVGQRPRRPPAAARAARRVPPQPRPHAAPTAVSASPPRTCPQPGVVSISALIPQRGKHLARRGLGDPVLLVNRNDGRHHRTGSQFPGQDPLPQGIPDLHPWWDVALALGHGQNLPCRDKLLPARACVSVLYCVMAR